MVETASSDIHALVLGLVPKDGPTIGCISLLRAARDAMEADVLGYDEDAVNAAREELLAVGMLGKGRGRGGSVYRKALVEPKSHSTGKPANGSEAHFLKYDQLYLFGFAIQAKARELVEDHRKLRIPVGYVNVTPDVVMTDLLKTSHTDQIFSVTGLPDVQLKPAGKGDDGQPLYRVKMRGLDTFSPADMTTTSVAADNLPCWMLDRN